MAHTHEEFGGLAAAIPPFAKLLWSLLNNLQLFVLFRSFGRIHTVRGPSSIVSGFYARQQELL